MNKEAEEYLEKLTENDNGYVADLVRDAMLWAYADAARICKKHGKGIEYGDEHDTFVTEGNESVMCKRY